MSTTPAVVSGQVNWSEYQRWNDAIAEEFFSGRFGDRPVYLDLEDDVCQAIAERIDFDGPDPREAILAATIPTLTVSRDGRGTFSDHSERLRAWRLNGRSGWPPFIGALALLSLVAEEMATSEDFSARNYYGRLLRHLGEDPADERLRHKLIRDFARQSHDLWEALNDWLLEDPEVRGYPTAYSFDYRAHIGRPISQALLREGDRVDLLKMFAEWRFEPGNGISPSVMRDLLRDAISDCVFSGTLQRIAQQPDALERLAEVACAELSAWKGDGETEVAAGLTLVGARRTRPFPSLALTPVSQGLEAAGEVEISFLDSQGAVSKRTAGFVEAADEFGFARVMGLGAADLLAATVTVSSDAREVTRSPRVLVLLEHRPERGRFEEVRRAQLGAEYLLLVREGLVGAVRAMLEGAARPGWEMQTPEQLPGVPEGWRALMDVQLLAIPETLRPDLMTLVPVGWTRLSLSGGMVLPGRQSFLTGHPPEVAASVIDSRVVHATLVREGAAEAEELGDVSHAAAWSLEELDPQLQSGNHRVTLLAERPEDDVRPETADDPDEGITEEAVLDSVRISLFDPDAPLEREIEIEGFGHALGDPASVLGAARSAEVDAKGAFVPARTIDEVQASEPLPSALEGNAPNSDTTEDDGSDVAISEVVSEGVEAATCIETGAHLMREVEGAQASGGEAPWRCAYCGLERYFPTSLARLRRRKGARGSDLDAAVLELPRRQDPGLTRDHAALIAAVCTVRTGSWGDFSRLVTQVDDRPWATREVGRLYSALGLIDVECSPVSLEPVAWQVAPPVLVHADDRVFLAGWRSPQLIAELALVTQAGGGELQTTTHESGIPVVALIGVDDETLGSIGELLDAAQAWTGVSLQREPGVALAAGLPSLQAVRECLPRGYLPDQGLERYQPETGRWVPHTGTSSGAFRSSRRGWRWWHVDEQGDARVVDSRLGKWLAARDRRVPTLAYRSSDSILLARLGSPLFGLYERAAVLCSGLPPIELEGHLIGYPNVPEPVARSLASALGDEPPS